MKIYFAGAIRGGREDAEIYTSLIQFLKSYGTVLTEHVGDETLLDEEHLLSEEEIYERDMQWLAKADLLIAEVSTPSLGVGYELGVAEKLAIPCLCLFRKQHDKNLSAMIAGNTYFHTVAYRDIRESQRCIEQFIRQIK